MGEMADLVADQAFDCDDFVSYGVTCKYCGTKDLFWGVHQEQWRLFSENGLHSCVDKYLVNGIKCTINTGY